MKNTDHIKQTYKSSTITRLGDLGYETEDSINLDPDITYALEICKEIGKESQDTLFNVINNIHQEFYNMMDNNYPNGLFTN